MKGEVSIMNILIIVFFGRAQVTATGKRAVPSGSHLGSREVSIIKFSFFVFIGRAQIRAAGKRAVFGGSQHHEHL